MRFVERLLRVILRVLIADLVNRFLTVLSRHRESLEQQREDIEITLAEIAAHEDRCRNMLAQDNQGEKIKSGLLSASSARSAA